MESQEDSTFPTDGHQVIVNKNAQEVECKQNADEK